MRLYPNPDLFERVFGEAEISKMDIPLHQRQERLIPSVIDALTAAASLCFDVELKMQPLSPDEWQAIGASAPWKTICLNKG
jgi:lipoate---protein ligase